MFHHGKMREDDWRDRMNDLSASRHHESVAAEVGHKCARKAALATDVQRSTTGALLSTCDNKVFVCVKAYPRLPSTLPSTKRVYTTSTQRLHNGPNRRTGQTALANECRAVPVVMVGPRRALVRSGAWQPSTLSLKRRGHTSAESSNKINQT